MKKLLFIMLFLGFAGVSFAQDISVEGRGFTQPATAGASIQPGQILKLDANGRFIPVTTADSSGAFSIAQTGASQSGVNFRMAIYGYWPILVDGACSNGQILSISSTVAGSAHCASGPTGQQIGTAISPSSVAGTIQANLNFSGTGSPTFPGLATFNAGLTSAGPNSLSGGGSLAGTFSGTPIYSGLATFNGGISTAKLNNIQFADLQVGADWCAKVTAADTALGSTSGEIWVSQLAGTSACAAAPTLSALHTLRFIQGGVYSISVGWTQTNLDNWAIIGSERTILSFTGSAGFVMDGTSELGGERNVLIDNITFSGNAGIVNVFTAKRIEQNTFKDVSFINCTGTAMLAQWAIANVFIRPAVSTNDHFSGLITFSTIPSVGLQFDQLNNANQQSTVNTILDPIVENLSGSTGISFVSGFENVVTGGTSEGVATGINFSSSASRNMIFGTDMEANTFEDIHVAGAYNVIQAIQSTRLAHLVQGSNFTRIIGGVYQQLTIDSRVFGTIVDQLNYSTTSPGGVITDNGNLTTKFGNFNNNLLIADQNVWTQTDFNGQARVLGTLDLIQIPTPSAPTVTPTCTTCTTTWTYTVVAKGGTGTTVASPTGTTAVGGPTLGGAVFNVVSWTPVAGATTYDVYRTVAAGTPNTIGKIATIQAATTPAWQVTDNGLAGDASSSPATNTTGTVYAPNGTVTAPTISFTGSHTSGLWMTGGGALGIASNGSDTFSLFNARAAVAATGIFGFSANGGATNAAPDTAISRGAAGVLDIGTGASGNTAGFVKASQTNQVITSNYTTTSTTLAAAGVITGLSFTTPTSFASNWSFSCNLIYSQATAAAANLFGITTTQTAPTNLEAFGEVKTALSATGEIDGSSQITTATSTTLVTATPSAFGAIGTVADMFAAHIWGTIEAPSNASPSVVGLSVATGNASDALTIYRGSSCWWY